MRMKNRILAFLLVFCMVYSTAGTALASQEPSVADEIVTEAETVEETGAESEGETESEIIEEETTEVVESETVTEETTVEFDFTGWGDGISSIGLESIALTMGTRPANGTTTGQPFPSGTGDSTCFRIPAMVTLNSGRIVAAADARWNSAMDGGGMDNIVSYSDDNGATWNYTFANYLGDNGNVFNKASSSFLDPALATDGTTVYMLVDLFPAGYALNVSSANKEVEAIAAFNSNGKLLLKKNNESAYNYYLDGTTIYKNDGTVDTTYTVDAYFNITGNGVNSNLFFSDSPYKVAPTTYLYLTKSTDGGATWSAPTLLNVKKDDERFYGVGPGRGIVSNGRIIFPCYTNKEGGSGFLGLENTERTSFIYSDDGGATWKRTAEVSDTSSEATIVKAGDKLYAFTRCSNNNDYSNVTYYTSSDNGTTWSTKVDDTGIDPCTNCQMNAITYSQKIDGKDAIILSCASGNARANGKIYVGLVEADGSLSWPYSYTVNNSFFAYSCLTELKDGSIALAYESAADVITYEVIPFNEIVPENNIFTIVANNDGKATDYHNYQKVEHLILGSGKAYPVTIYRDGQPLQPAEYTVTWSNNGTSSEGYNTTIQPHNGVVTATIKSGNEIVAEVSCTVEAISTVGSGSTGRDYEVYVKDLENTRLYYQHNNSDQIGELSSYTVLYYESRGNYAFNVYAEAINEEYALCDLSGKHRVKKLFSDNQEVWNGSEWKGLANLAVLNGCDAYATWSRTDQTNLLASISAKSEKLPKVSKVIESVTRGTDTLPYTDNMTVYPGDVLNYKVNITTAPNKTIPYVDPTLTESMDGAVLVGGVLTVPGEHTVQYTVKDSDAGKTLINTATFSMSYTTKYKTKTYTTSATSAPVHVKAKEFNYVIDFSLPVEIDLTSSLTGATITEGTADYGTITPNAAGTGFTYTPTSVLASVAQVILTLSNGTTYTGYIHPASTVFYEESFVTSSNGWTSHGTAPTTQDAAILGQDGNNVGYDVAYNITDNSYLETNTVGSDALEFNFTGTGVTLYGNTAADTGKMIVRVYKINADGTKKAVKMYSVDTAMKSGTTSVTANQAVNDKSFPLISMKGLERGNYQLLISYMNADQLSKPIRIDGFRVYGTIDDGSNPTYINLRDALLNGYHVDTVASTESEYVGTDANGQKYYVNQVYDAAEVGQNAIAYVNAVTDFNITDLLNNGPKNQIYLKAGEGITFTMTGNYTAVQLGMKRIGDAAITVNGEAVDSNTEMFYTLTKTANDTYEIVNNGTGILAITDLIAIGGTATLSAPPVQQIASFARGIMLMSLMHEEPSVPEAPATTDAVLNISIMNWDEEILGTTSLTKNGPEGEAVTFTEAEIKAAVDAMELPEGYAYDTLKYYDVQTMYGETASFNAYAETVEAEVPEAKEATLTIVVKTMFGKEIARDVLVYSGVEGEVHTFSKTEVNASVNTLLKENGYQASVFNIYKAVTVTCGEEKEVTYVASLFSSLFR